MTRRPLTRRGIGLVAGQPMRVYAAPRGYVLVSGDEFVYVPVAAEDADARRRRIAQGTLRDSLCVLEDTVERVTPC